MDTDALIQTAVFSPDDTSRNEARKKLRKLAQEKGVYPASIHKLYMELGKNTITGFTVPAINIRMMTYDTARAIFRLVKTHKIGPFIFEIARSEQGYTEQTPDEYTCAILAAAIKEEYKGPVFLQGDHYQFKAKVYRQNPDQEIEAIKKLIADSVAAGFYNIDIDASTLVDLDKTTLDEQQKSNYEMTALLTKFIREIEPKDITVSIGGEIGHIGGKNSTVEEFRAFMEGLQQSLKSSESGASIQGISKVSVQTGTSHGGVPLADGSIAKVQLDFSVLQAIGKAARDEYHIGGAVQHGASTLPDELFDRFPETQTLEIHLATGFQNTVYDNLPADLKKRMYEWIKENLQKERKEGWTDEQFIYKTRKKAFGPFKKDLWQLPEDQKRPIIAALEKQFLLLFRKLQILDTAEKIQDYV
ncbi:MAG: class II fructose-bisphosphate aldolase [Patescibacteria group bacterium]